MPQQPPSSTAKPGFVQSMRNLGTTLRSGIETATYQSALWSQKLSDYLQPMSDLLGDVGSSLEVVGNIATVIDPKGKTKLGKVGQIGSVIGKAATTNQEMNTRVQGLLQSYADPSAVAKAAAKARQEEKEKRNRRKSKRKSKSAGSNSSRSRRRGTGSGQSPPRKR